MLVFKEDTLTTALKGKTGGDVLNYQSSTEMIPPGQPSVTEYRGRKVRGRHIYKIMLQNNKENEYVLWGSESFTMGKMVGFLMPYLKDKLIFGLSWATVEFPF